jgi:ribosomal protein S28E/S33
MTGMEMSRCRYVMCGKCNAVYNKETTLSNWRFSLGNAGEVITFGTRTCKCGNVMQVADIYAGAHDLPRSYWNQVQGPIEVT